MTSYKTKQTTSCSMMPSLDAREHVIRAMRTLSSRLRRATLRPFAALVAVMLILAASGAVVGCELIEMATGGPTEADTIKARATAFALDAEATIAATSKLIEEEPADVEALLRRGNARLRLDRLEEALADYELAIAQDPKYAPAYNNRGVVYSRMGQPAEAASDYERAVDLDPNLAIPFYNRAVDLDNAVSLKIGDFRLHHRHQARSQPVVGLQQPGCDVHRPGTPEPRARRSEPRH